MRGPMRGAATTLRPADKRAAQRWLARIEPDTGGHFLWPGYVDRFGYGRIIVEVRGERVQWNAHQLVWGALVGPVPAGHTLVPLCLAPGCVNPEHWEPMTPGDRVAAGNSPFGVNARKVECLRGHSLTDPANVQITPAGRRVCRACRRQRQRASRT
jgi:hypothetical protein